MSQQTEIPADPLEELEQVEQQAQAEREEAQTTEQAPQAQTPAPEGEPPAEEQRPEWQQQFETPEEMWDRLQNVDTLRGNLANTVGEERARAERAEAALQAYTGQGQQPPQGQQQQQDFGMDDFALPREFAEQLEDIYEQDPIAAFDAIATYRAVQVAAVQQQQLAPVFDTVNEAAADRSLNLLKGEFGDQMVNDNREALADALKNDRDYFAAPDKLHERLRRTIMAAEFDRTRNGRTEQAQTQTRAPNGQFAAGSGERTAYVEGGSTPAPSQGSQAPQTPEQEIVAAIDGAHVGGDAFGGLPRVGPV